MNEYAWEHLSIGLSHAFTTAITEPMMCHFRNDTGDVNPLHVDPAFAKSRGFDDIVVYGLLTSSFYSTLVGVYLPGRNALLHGVSIVFQAPVYVGMKLVVAGAITHLSQAYRRIEIAATIRSEDEQISRAKIAAGLHV